MLNDDSNHNGIDSRVPLSPSMAAESDDEAHWEALERALNEMEVLRAIYSSDEDEGECHFCIVAPRQQELNGLKQALGMDCDDDGDNTVESTRPQMIPDLLIEIRTNIEPSDEDGEITSIVLGFRLPRGYPETSPAFVTKLQTFPQQFHRNTIDEINRCLNERATNLLGTEAIMDIVEEAKNLCLEKHMERIKEQEQHNEQAIKEDEPQTLGRRWIWVHHITKSGRISSILEQAREHNLTGILKHGYPGVVLVEGTTQNCDAFVKWIKADKSTEGGFGRNWGHHVRGEITIDARSLPETNTMQSTEDLSVMSHQCREAGLEDEFREYVLQHK